MTPVFLAIFMILVFVGIGYILLMTNNCYVETEEMSETEKEKIAKEKKKWKTVFFDHPDNLSSFDRGTNVCRFCQHRI